MSKSPKNISHSAISDIFKAQVLNVRELQNAWTHINRTINYAYRNDDLVLAKHQTRMLALVFCAYAEANFSRLIHTPNGLNPHEITCIKIAQKKSIVKAWQECLKFSSKKIISKKSNHVPNIAQEINRLINSYIEEPSLIRNKIAHGQWAVALNSENTKVNNELTISIQALSVIDLYRYKSAFDSLSAILEDIIESPNKAHWKFYWEHITKFDDEQLKLSTHTLQGKIDQLKRKASYKNA